MEVLWNAVQTYGPSILVIACIIILILGILKLCKVFDKIESKDIKKCIYFAIDLVLSFVGSAIYFAIFGITFSGYYVLYSISLLAVVVTVYAFYEYFGLRWCVRKLISLLANFFKKNPKDAFTQAADKLGLDDAIIAWDEYLKKKAAEEKAKTETENTTKVSTETIPSVETETSSSNNLTT